MWKDIVYDRRYFDEMNAMTAENYGEDEITANPEFVEYEYFKNPAGDAIIELALDEEKNVLAGQYLVSPKFIYSKGETLKVILSLNTLTRKEYRGQKIFTGLAEITYDRASKEGYRFVYGAPNPNSHPGFLKKLNFKDLGYMALYLKPMNCKQMIKEKTGSRFLGAIASVGDLFFKTQKSDDSHIVKITDENVKLMDEFWDDIRDKYPVIGVRNAEYIFYRYLDVPIREYHPFFYIKDEKVIAYGVGRVLEIAGMTSGMIADFLYINGYENEAKELLNHLMNVMKKEKGACLAGCLIQNAAEEAGILKKNGFMRCPEKLLPQPTPIIYRKLDPEYDDAIVKDWRNWFFTAGDYDVI